jgi:glycine/D-amino acid oxidase-like deaminating enzyme
MRAGCAAVDRGRTLFRSAHMPVPARPNLHSGAPFWLVRNGVTDARPALHEHTACDVVIIGAGVTGALLADSLTSAGLDAIVIDRRESGAGSTAASTALLQYEIDLELRALQDMLGREDATRAYRASAAAVAFVSDLAIALGGCDLQPRASLYLASTRTDARRLEREADLRASIGLAATWWTKRDVAHRYGFPSHGAIRSTLGAEVDALQLTRRLLERAEGRGARWYEQTGIRGFEERGARVRMLTTTGVTIDAGRAICATGYDVPDFLLQDRVALHSSYALATHRLPHFGPWDDRCLVWESARPYCYMRTTADRRVIIGGEDVPFRDAAWRDRLLPTKTKRLEARLRSLLPSVATETAFEWAGTFAETPDGLPYIGEDPRYPGVLFAMGYGGNGITFSAIAARVLTAMCLNQVDSDAELFRMDRQQPAA